MGEIVVAKAATLLSKEYKHELAKRLRDMGMSRLGTTKWLLDVLFAYVAEGGRVLGGDGIPIRIGADLEQVIYGEDLACSWNSDVVKFSDRMPKRGSKWSLLPRLRCFDAAFRITGQPIEVSLSTR